MDITLESLGLSVEKMQDRLVEAMIDRFLTSVTHDEDGEPVVIASRFKEAVNKAITDRVDEKVDMMLAPILGPAVDTYLTNFRIKHTNGYGEPKRDPETITEYVVRRSNEYLTEGVNWQGQTKDDFKKSGRDTYGFKAETTRAAFLIDKRLHEEMEKSMKEALVDANKAITNGLKSAVIFELDKLNAKLKGAA